MDRVRARAGLLWAAVGLAAMLLWSWSGPDRHVGAVTWTVTGFVVIAGITRARSPRMAWWGARLAAVAIGILLLGAVADRFGLFGAPGDPGVSWGDWAHFRAETAELVPWSGLVQPAAIAATTAELVVGGLLVVGSWWRWAGKAAAGLFFVYLLAMLPGTGGGSVLEYGVPVLIGGSLIASARGPRPGRDRPHVRPQTAAPHDVRDALHT